MKLTNSRFCVFGLQESGKSTFVDWLLSNYKTRGLYYDTLSEAPEKAPYDIYQPKHGAYNVTELETVIAAIIPAGAVAKKAPYKIFVIDEANRFCPSKPAPLPFKVAELNDQNAHYGMTVGYVARRVSQLNQDLTDLASHLFVFKLTGVNDVAALNRITEGLGDAARDLAPHSFVIVYPDRHFESHKPITPNPAWIRRKKQLRGE